MPRIRETRAATTARPAEIEKAMANPALNGVEIKVGKKAFPKILACSADGRALMICPGNRVFMGLYPRKAANNAPVGGKFATL